MPASSKHKITIPFIPGDGIGQEIMDAARMVIDAAVQQVYGVDKSIRWKEISAGEKAFDQTGSWLPDATIQTIRTHKIAIKGPLTTPVGKGIRSLNVALRQSLDLYVCQRPVQWFDGLPSPLNNPLGIDIITFRENTEDLYTGIEYQAGTPAHQLFMEMIRKNHPEDFKKITDPDHCGIGIKPISKSNSRRIMAAAIQWAKENQRSHITIVHKGNIMKYTEGAFRQWAYETAENDFRDVVFTARQYKTAKETESEAQADAIKQEALSRGKLWIDDVIADVVFEQLITKPQSFDTFVTTNLNGDYLSDAAAALAGGVGISPGANINYHSGTALFEANHGSAVGIAGKGIANPSSLILSAVMMLDFIGWEEAAQIILAGVKQTIQSKKVTPDLADRIENATTLSTQQYTQAIIQNIFHL